MSKELPIPGFYNAANSRSWGYRPNDLALFEEAEKWVKKHNLKPAASQKLNVEMLIIDAQKDFCFPEGTLYVAGRSGTGAMDDMVDALKPVAFAFIMNSVDDFARAAKIIAPEIIFKSDAFLGHEQEVLGKEFAKEIKIVRDVVDHSSTTQILEEAVRRALLDKK